MLNKEGYYGGRPPPQLGKKFHLWPSGISRSREDGHRSFLHFAERSPTKPVLSLKLMSQRKPVNTRGATCFNCGGQYSEFLPFVCYDSENEDEGPETPRTEYPELYVRSLRCTNVNCGCGIPYDKAIYLIDKDGYMKTKQIGERYYPVLATLDMDLDPFFLSEVARCEQNRREGEGEGEQGQESGVGQRRRE